MSDFTHMRELDKILKAAPVSNNNPIDWAALEDTCLGPIFTKMAQTQQNLRYHGEGDVYTHTRMVCEALVALPEYQTSDVDGRRILFLATLLHDIGKIRCTRLKDGEWTSPYHTSVGAVMAREILWKELGLSGSREAQVLRESICSLIRYHSFPPYAAESASPQQKFLRIASVGELAEGFSLRRLCLLERADGLGRICEDVDAFLEKTGYCEMMAEEYGVLDRPYKFADAYSQRAFFRGKSDWCGNQLFNESWGEVILMSGLPGTGKDTWIEKNHPDLPTVCLDDIRRVLNISPTENQGQVVAEAHRQARELLRAHQPFIWNATSITAQLRGKQIELFEQYGASVRCVFLETGWQEELRRNSEREASVPEAVIDSMLSRLEPPERFESCYVDWLIT